MRPYDYKTARKALADRILARGSPRLQMSLVLSGSALGGWIASMALHRAGVTSMAARFPLSTLGAYAVFFLCLYLWVRVMTTRMDADAVLRGTVNAVEDSVDAADSAAGGRVFARAAENSDTLKDISAGDLVPGDLDEGAALLLLLAILAILFSAAIYMVYIAPTFIADILMGGMLSAGMYRKLKDLELTRWVGTAFKRTWWIFLAIAALTGLCGLGIQRLYPAAHTLADLLRMIAN